MFLSDNAASGTMLHTNLESLKLTLGFAFITNVMLVFFLETVLHDTLGYCDSENTDKSSAFSLMMIIQLALGVPVVYYYHRAALFDYVEKSADYAITPSSLLTMSFFFYLASQCSILFLMMRTFLQGPAQDYSARFILSFAAISFTLAFSAIVKFVRQRV